MHTTTSTKIKFICSIMAFLFFTTYAYAEPTKNETYEIIANDVVIYSLPFVTGYNTRSIKLSSSEDACILYYTTEVRDGDNNWLSTNQYTVDLKTVNPISINERYNSLFKERSVYFETIEKKHLIVLNSTHSNQMKATYKYTEDRKSHLYFLNFLTVNLDAAERVAKALKHLVTICGGKDE